MSNISYTQKDLIQRARPRPDGGFRLDLQIAKVRKTFYSKKIGDNGRKECAQKALAWLEGKCPINALRLSTNDVFNLFLIDKSIETNDIYNITNYYKNHIRPVIGAIPIMHLSQQDLKRVISTAFSRDLSEKSLKNIRGILSSFCLFLQNSDIRYDLSTKSIKIPRSARKSIKKALSVEGIYIVFSSDFTILNHVEKSDDLVNAYRLMIAIGLRPGEILGLQWGDIDKDTIHIRRAINAKNERTDGKNSLAIRDLPQTKHTRGIFDAQEQFRCTNSPTERVFGTYAETTLRSRWERYCDHNGIPYITPYELRHTFASIYKTALPLWTLDELMGHAHQGVTLGVYSHAMAYDMNDVPRILEEKLHKQYKLGQSAYCSHNPNR